VTAVAPTTFEATVISRLTAIVVILAVMLTLTIAGLAVAVIAPTTFGKKIAAGGNYDECITSHADSYCAKLWPDE
jgi:hypothetical protein